jgi:hydrogenase maturation protease
MSGRAQVNRNPRILAVGLGNVLLRDDGVGVHAVRRFHPVARRSFLPVEVGTAVLQASHLFEHADRVLAFDAMISGRKPGTIYALHAGEVQDGSMESMHEIGLIRLLKTLPMTASEIVVIAAEPQIIDWGLELTRPVAAAVPTMLAAGHLLINHWRSGRNVGDHIPQILRPLNRGRYPGTENRGC